MVASTTPAAQPLLPTLLASRRQHLAPALASLPEEKLSAAKLPSNGLPWRVRNTFIDTEEPSMDRFHREREVSTCPSSCIGRLRGTFRDEEEEEEERLNDEEGCNASSPAQGFSTPVHDASPCRMWLPLPARPVLSLAALIGLPPTPAAAPQYAPAPEAQGRGTPYPPQHRSGASALAAAAGPLMVAQPPPAAPPAPLGPELPDPLQGSEALPSAGSALHAAGECKPCAFFHSGRCGHGAACTFCHLCDAGERKRRRREKLESKRLANRLRRAAAEAEAAEST